MTNIFTKDFILAALTRAVKTFAQTLLGFLAVGLAISDINWANALSVSAVAMLFSILTSIVTGLPEAQNDGSIEVIATEDGPAFNMIFDQDEDLKKLATALVSGKQNRVSLKLEQETKE